jgi:hypothetical protein
VDLNGHTLSVAYFSDINTYPIFKYSGSSDIVVTNGTIAITSLPSIAVDKNIALALSSDNLTFTNVTATNGIWNGGTFDASSTLSGTGSGLTYLTITGNNISRITCGQNCSNSHIESNHVTYNWPSTQTGAGGAGAIDIHDIFNGTGNWSSPTQYLYIRWNIVDGGWTGTEGAGGNTNGIDDGIIWYNCLHCWIVGNVSVKSGDAPFEWAGTQTDVYVQDNYSAGAGRVHFGGWYYTAYNGFYLSGNKLNNCYPDSTYFACDTSKGTMYQAIPFVMGHSTLKANGDGTYPFENVYITGNTTYGSAKPWDSTNTPPLSSTLSGDVGYEVVLIDMSGMTPSPTGTFKIENNDFSTVDGTHTNTAVISNNVESLINSPTSAVPNVCSLSGYQSSDINCGRTQYQFVPIAPCRSVDTRQTATDYGSPSLSQNNRRDIDLLSASTLSSPSQTTVPCGALPSGAVAVSANVTLLKGVTSTDDADVKVWPAGDTEPSTVASIFRHNTNGSSNEPVAESVGQIFKLGSTTGNVGKLSFKQTSSTNTDMLLDINGYFKVKTPTGGSPNTSGFFPVAPCRLLDTRDTTGTHGGRPSGHTYPLTGYPADTIDIQATGRCGIPSGATAISANVTLTNPVGGSGSATYVTLWAQGGTQPGVSTSNSFDGATVANAAIVPLNTSNGEFSLYLNLLTGVSFEAIVDVNGYFGPADGTGLSYFLTDETVSYNTDNTTPFSTGETRQIATFTNNDTGIPDSVAALQTGITAITSSSSAQLFFLTAFPGDWADSARPNASTLNDSGVRTFGVVNGATAKSSDLPPASLKVFTSITDPGGYTAKVILDTFGYWNW